MVIASPTIEKYFEGLRKDVAHCYDVANKAREKNLDPAPKPEIILANTMADRVLGLVSMVAPQILETTIPERVVELEKEYGNLDWRVGFKIAEEVAKEKFCKFKDKQEAIEIGIRTGFAYLTLGIVAAPLEGFIGIKIKKRKDGKEYIALQYAGPIRGAGGTASSTSVILSDYVRVKMGYAKYDPSETEVKRYVTEVHDYHDRVTNLQYHPGDEELQFMLSHLPVEVDGDPTEKIEVSNFKDQPRIDTNLIRGGMCLVVAEGLCQKAPKLWKRLSKWGKDFDLEWEFMKDFIDLKNKIHASHGKKKKKDGEEEEIKVQANDTFIADMVAGRPVLTHPVRDGGFRLRYGRCRNTGFSTSALHPATMIVLDKFIAIGTQLKTERPGKATTTVLCDTIEGPIVRMKNGSLIKIKTQEEAVNLNKDIDEVIYLGDILTNYGDFSENGHKLVPPGYCPEWWALELEKAVSSEMGSLVKKCVEDPLYFIPTLSEAIELSEKYKVPLHPEYTYFWKTLDFDNFNLFVKYLKKARVKGSVEKLILPFSEEYEKEKRILELLGIPHGLVNKEHVVIEKDDAETLAYLFNFKDQESLAKIEIEGKERNALAWLNNNSKILQRDKSGTFVGARMGRPEKAKMRSLTGKPHVMFPVGEEGGRLRCFQAAMEIGKVRSSFPLFHCDACDKESVYARCDYCNAKCLLKYHCRFCGDLEKETCKHGPAYGHKMKDVKINEIFEHAKKRLGERIHPDLIKGIRGTSNREHLVEHLAKGILRAKHNIYVNKDGTTRYDMTELPLTHFKLKEIGISVKKIKELGYSLDVHGKEIVDKDQLIEMKPQDLILPGMNLLEESAADVLLRVSKYIDELLVKFYGFKSFYNAKKPEDLAGHLVIGLAPHISAGTVGRIIGFSQTQGMLAHPMYHAGLRRDCDGDEAAVMLMVDGLLNFSKKFLPSSRGSTMDAPLVLTPILSPSEVDDQVLGIDMEWKYPLEFFEAAMEMKAPWDVRYGDDKKIVQLDHKLDTPGQYEGFAFTHHIDDFNAGPNLSAYKTLPSMKEKLFGQMELARKIRAVDMGDVARMVIQRHFLADIKGNFRKFSMQGFRCGKCNTKYRRPPISNKCHGCVGGKIIFTISEGSVVKYLEPSLELAREYDFSPYLKNTINLLKHNIYVVFGKEKDKQVGLGVFMK